MRTAQYQASALFACTLLLILALRGKNDVAHLAVISAALAYAGAYAGSVYSELLLADAVRDAAFYVGCAATVAAVVFALCAMVSFLG